MQESRLPFLKLPLPQKETPPTRSASYKEIAEAIESNVDAHTKYACEDVLYTFKGILMLFTHNDDYEEKDIQELNAYIETIDAVIKKIKESFDYDDHIYMISAIANIMSKNHKPSSKRLSDEILSSDVQRSKWHKVADSLKSVTGAIKYTKITDGEIPSEDKLLVL